MGLPSGAGRLDDPFSTQRLPQPGFGLTTTTPIPTIPLDGALGSGSAGTVVGTTMGDKRRIGDNRAEPTSPSSKRRKKVSTIGSNTAKDIAPTPAFIDRRLASLSNAVRMPNKRDSGPQPEQLDPLHQDDLIKRLLPKHGAFPMPNVRDISSESGISSRYSLNKFSKLWDETDEETRREVLARRLEQTSVPIPPRNYSDKANKSG